MKKQKFNLVLTSPPQQQQQPQVKVQSQASTIATANTVTATTAVPKTVSLQDLKLFSPGSKCFLPITLKDGSNNDQQIMAQIDTKNLVLPTYVQMKLQPQITTVDGQQVVQLTSATSLPSSISLASVQPQFVQSQIQLPQIQTQTPTSIIPETSTLFTTSTGQNVTITHHPIQQQINSATTVIPTVHTIPQHTSTLDTPVGKVQLTTLQNVATPNVTHPFPQNITLQRVKVENDNSNVINISQPITAVTKTVTKEQTFKLPTVSNVITSSTNTIATNKKIVRKVNSGPRNVVTTSSPKATTATSTSSTLASTTATTATITTTATSTTAPKTTANSKQRVSRAIVTAVSTGTTATNTTTTAPVSSGDGKTDVPTCEICMKVFKRKEHLAQHLKLHLGLRPFKCEESNCNKAFSRKEHLMRHRVSHTGKKQFDCEFCHKLFSRKDNLNKHKRYVAQ